MVMIIIKTGLRSFSDETFSYTPHMRLVLLLYRISIQTSIHPICMGVHIDVLQHSLPVLQHSMTNLTEEPILSDNITYKRSMKNSSIITASVTHILIHQVTQCCISYCNVVHTLPEVGRLRQTCQQPLQTEKIDCSFPQVQLLVVVSQTQCLLSVSTVCCWPHPPQQ